MGKRRHSCRNSSFMDPGFCKPDDFGKNVFTIDKMKRVVPSNIFEQYVDFIENGTVLSDDVAQTISDAIREWAFTFGATHYAHWFQPIRSCPAEKHDTFFAKSGINVLPKFSCKQLIRNETDGSSLPSGGNRRTECARAYTIWDPTSPPFILTMFRTVVLYIPAFFCSWSGESLDFKLPLARSSRCLSMHATHLLHQLGMKDVKSVSSLLGVEQEFFVIDKDYCDSRPDIKHTGRTLVGHSSIKLQELQDMYFKKVPKNVISLIQNVESELWKLGILITTRHSEVAPSQFEVAIIHDESNVIADRNQLLMHLLTELAARYNLSVLFHEKPFMDFNGSGKHNNWSIITNDGLNLLEISSNPTRNQIVLFKVFVSCVIRAVHLHADLLRAVVAVPGNEHRLGGNEAPPSIISLYLGEMVTSIMKEMVNINDISFSHEFLDLVPGILPVFDRDVVDRNRTSVFAYTGNRFEFRAVGSSQHTGIVSTIMNAIVTESIVEFSKLLESELGSTGSVENAALKIVTRFVTDHEKIIFNGDGYSHEWQLEAIDRGLVCTKEWYKALDAYKDEKNITLFQSLHILSPKEVELRRRVFKESFATTLMIEAKTLVDLIFTKIIPAGFKFYNSIPKAINPNDAIDIYSNRVYSLINEILELTLKFQSILDNSSSGPSEDYHLWTTNISTPMTQLRPKLDELETLSGPYWPLPRYIDILF